MIIIDVNSINLNSRKFTTSEIGIGVGTIKPKKGKGSLNLSRLKSRECVREIFSKSSSSA